MRKETLKRVREEFEKIEKIMKDLQFLRQVSGDLRIYKRMIKLKKYD